MANDENKLTKLPNDIEIRRAQFPENYKSAKLALANCFKVDEAKEWSDKASAIATYARQSQDNALLSLAAKIKVRAVRRAGELLKEYNQGVGRPQKNGGGTPTITQRQAAKKAGMSKDQEVTAVRVANVPDEDFEAAVEGEKTPSVTKLAEAGKKKKPKSCIDYGIDPADFVIATSAMGPLGSCSRVAKSLDPKVIVRGTLPHEYSKMTDHIKTIKPWLDSLLDEYTKKENPNENQ